MAKLAINSDARGGRVFLLGNEAIAREVIEGGIQLAAAVIESNPDTTLGEEELYKFCEEKLSRYNRPVQIYSDKVPRKSTGKLEKPKLREKYDGQKESFKL